MLFEELLLRMRHQHQESPVELLEELAEPLPDEHRLADTLLERLPWLP